MDTIFKCFFNNWNSLQLDSKAPKIDDKKVSAAKPTFSGPSPAVQRKDSTGQKVESQSTLKSDDSSKSAVISSQAPQPHRIEKTPPFAGDKLQHR